MHKYLLESLERGNVGIIVVVQGGWWQWQPPLRTGCVCVYLSKRVLEIVCVCLCVCVWVRMYDLVFRFCMCTMLKRPQFKRKVKQRYGKSADS